MKGCILIFTMDVKFNRIVEAAFGIYFTGTLQLALAFPKNYPELRSHSMKAFPQHEYSFKKS